MTLAPRTRAAIRTALGAAAGAVAGAAYAHFVGCRSGTCALTSDARVSALFFGVVGAIVAAPPASPRPRGSAPPAPSDRAD